MLEKILQIKYSNSTCEYLLVADCESLNKQLNKFIKAINRYRYLAALIPAHEYFYLDDVCYICPMNIESVYFVQEEPTPLIGFKDESSEIKTKKGKKKESK